MTKAADTLRRLPRPSTRPRLRRWPAYARDWWHAYDGSEAPEVRPGRPPPAAIDQMDAVTQWPLWLDDVRSQRIVVSRMFNVGWREIQSLDGRSEPTLRKAYRASPANIAVRLNRLGTKVF